MSKKTTMNPIPSGTKTLRDILPETESKPTITPTNIVPQKRKVEIAESNDKDDFNAIDKDMNKLNIDKLDLDEDDDRDALIIKLQEVNEKLKYKLKDLEQVVEATVEKSYKAAKGTINTHREWDTQDETLKEKDRQLREYQAQIEVCKKTVKGLKNRLSALTNLDKMVHVNNELKDAERIKNQLEDEVRILQKNNDYQAKALGKLADDVDYETKITTLNTELGSLREEYKKLGKEHKAKEMIFMEHHKRMVSVEEENARLKRILIALKNNKDPFEGLDNTEELLRNAKKEVDSYEQAIKAEDKRHQLKTKKLEDMKSTIQQEVSELEKQIKGAESENSHTANKIKSSKQMIKENQDKIKKLLIEQKEAEEKAKEEEEEKLRKEKEKKEKKERKERKEKEGEGEGRDDGNFYDDDKSDRERNEDRKKSGKEDEKEKELKSPKDGKGEKVGANDTKKASENLPKKVDSSSSPIDLNKGSSKIKK